MDVGDLAHGLDGFYMDCGILEIILTDISEMFNGFEIILVDLATSFDSFEMGFVIFEMGFSNLAKRVNGFKMSLATGGKGFWFEMRFDIFEICSTCLGKGFDGLK